MKRAITITMTQYPKELKYNIVADGDMSTDDLNDAIDLIGKTNFIDGLVKRMFSGDMGPWRISSVRYKVEAE